MSGERTTQGFAPRDLKKEVALRSRAGTVPKEAKEMLLEGSKRRRVDPRTAKRDWMCRYE